MKLFPHPRPTRALILATLVSSSIFVQSAPVPVPAPGDVFAGFRASDGQGAESSYLINLGPDTQYRNAAPGSSFEVTGLGNVGADLAAVFGAGWSTRNTVLWGIFGERASVNSTVFGSRGRTISDQVAPAWPALNSTGRNGVASAITSVLEGVGGYGSATATANSTVATIQPNSLEASSYARQVGTPGTTDFSSLSQWTSIETDFGGGSSSAILDLFRVASAGTSHLGSFSIDGGGKIRFTAVSLPSGGDADGDGFSDGAENTAGTNPGSGDSFPQAQVSLVGGSPRVQAVTVANRNYAIEYSETLAATSWVEIGTHLSGAAATPVDFVDTDAVRLAKGRGYYRIKITS